MKKSIKSYITTTLAITMFITMLSSCSQNTKQLESTTPTTDKQTVSQVSETPIATSSTSNQPTYLNSESQFPIVNEPITLRIMAKQAVIAPPYESVYLLKKYEEMTNIKIDWQNIPAAGATEALNLAFASGDLPDAILKFGMNTTQQAKFGDEGSLLDISDLIPEFAPNFNSYMQKYPDVIASQTYPGGEIYSIPAAVDSTSTRNYRKWLFRTDWLKTLGLEMPTTTDELYTVLKAIRNNDPNGNGLKDEIPVFVDDGQFYDTIKGSFGLGNRGVHHALIDQDETTGKIRITATVDSYRDFLTFANKLYSEELINQEIFTYSNNDRTAKMSQDLVGSFVDTALSLVPSDKKDFYAGLPMALTGPTGIKMFTPIRSHLHSTGAFVLTSNNKYPEATLRWVDYFYSDEGVLFYHYGIEGDTTVKQVDGTYKYSDEILAKITGNTTYDEVIANYSPFPFGSNPTIMKYPFFSGGEMDPIMIEAANNLEPFTPKVIWPFFTFTPEENTELASLHSDLDKYIKKMRSEFIAGTTPINNQTWETYLDTISKMGAEKYLALNEAALARVPASAK